MSYTYLLGAGEESSAASFSDIPQSVLSRLNLTAESLSCSDSETAPCRGSRSGTTSAPSTALPGEDSSTSSAAGSPAKTSASLARAEGSRLTDPDCGFKWPESYAKFDPATSLLKTPQYSLDGDLTEFSGALPRWGSMRDGELSRLKTPYGLLEIRQFITSVSESGFSPAPTPTDGAKGGSISRGGDRKNELLLGGWAKKLPSPKAEDAQCAGGHRGKDDTLYGALVRPKEKLPTPHGFSKDGGKSNGPSGNELGRAVNESLKLPTAKARDYRSASGNEQRDNPDLNVMVKRLGTPTAHPRTHTPREVDHGIQLANQVGGSLNPNWVEFYMGWPIFWTSLAPLPPEVWAAWQRAWQIESPD